MRKILLLLLVVPLSLIGQSFNVTPNGLRDKDNLEKSYLVLSFEGKTAKQLYDKAFRYMNETQNNPDASTRSNIQSEYLRYKTLIIDGIRYKQGYLKLAINIEYQVDLKFKDGKIKYELLNIKMPARDNNYSLVFSAGKLDGYYIVYDNKGKLYKKEAKDDLETLFNSRVKDFIDYINKDESNDDW